MLPGSPVSPVDAYGRRLRTHLVPLGEHAACVARRHVWILDGKSAARPLVTDEPVLLADPDGKGRIAIVHAAVGLRSRKEILLLAAKSFAPNARPGVYRFDGKKPIKEEVRGFDAKHGALSASGDRVVLFAPAEGETKWNRTRWKKLLCWRRSPEGAWSGPAEVVKEEKPFSEWNASVYTPEGFVVLAWVAGEELKVLLVPTQFDTLTAP